MRKAVQVNRDVGRRALCPTLSLTAHLCYLAAGDMEKAEVMLQLCRSYQSEKKKWSPVDATSLRQAEIAYRAGVMGHDEYVEVVAADGSVYLQPWRPNLLLFRKVCVVYRAVCFMQPEHVRDFRVMVQAEVDSCGDDVDSRCMGLFVLAEAMRQCEQWDEALKYCEQCLALGDQLSPEGRKGGSQQFCRLVGAYAYFAKGSPGESKEELTRLDALGCEHMWHREIEFKATHLRRLVGAEFQEAYRELVVGARSRTRLVVVIPPGLESVEWDWIVDDHSINFTALLHTDALAKREFVEETAEVLQSAKQHRGENGPCLGSCPVLEKTGRLELIFDNSFSMMRSKTVQCRVQPTCLKVELEENV